MRRKALIASLLLPLPFAALPLAGVLVGMGGSSHTVAVEAPQAQQRQIQFDSPSAAAPIGSLAYGVSEPYQSDCATHTDLRAES